MITLAVDTSTMMTTLALTDGEKLLGEFSLNQDMSHSEKLMPMLEEILGNLSIKVSDIDLYGVAKGPGSFTGLRIGIATIKALAHLFDKPIVGVSSLEALAYNLAHNNIIVPILDARRDRVYTGIYKWEEGQLKEELGDSIIEIDKLIGILGTYDKFIVNGEGSLVYKDRLEEGLGNKISFASINQNSSRASSICLLAREKYERGIYDDYYSLAPEYMRPSQAERNLKKELR